MFASEKRGGNAADREEFGEALVDRVASGKGIEDGAGVGHLLGDPLLCFGRVAILEPAVIVDNLGAVNDVEDRLDGSGRRSVGNFDGGRLRVAGKYRSSDQDERRHE